MRKFSTMIVVTGLLGLSLAGCGNSPGCRALTGAGIYYLNGNQGPKGDIRTASWSPDGRYVVFQKRLTVSLPALRKTFSRNPNYEVNLTGTYLPDAQFPWWASSGRRAERH